MMRVSLFGFLALGAAGSGAKNIDSLKAMFKTSEEILGKSIDKTSIQKLSDDIASHYASKINCAASPSSSIGFELKGVSFADCGVAWAKTYANMKYQHWSVEFAVVPDSGGKTCLAWEAQQYELPTGEMVSDVKAAKYEFDDEGLIVDINEEFDTSKVIEVAQAVGEKNLESARSMYKIAKEMRGKSTDQALMQKLTKDLASHYAPIVDCATSPSSSLGFALKGVPFADCGVAWAKTYANIRFLDWTVEFAVVPGSGGKTVLGWQPLDYDVAGEVVSSVITYKYKFDHEGRIISSHEELDMSKILENGGKTVALAEVFLPTAGTTQSITSFVAGCLTGAASFAAFLMVGRRQQEPLPSGYVGLVA